MKLGIEIYKFKKNAGDVVLLTAGEKGLTSTFKSEKEVIAALNVMYRVIHALESVLETKSVQNVKDLH